MQNTGRQIAKGAARMVLFKLTELNLGLISTAILTRLLIPQDFSVVATATAMAISVITVLELLGAFNFGLVLIHNRGAQDRNYNTARTFIVFFSVTCAILLVLGVPTAESYDEPRLVIVVLGGSIATSILIYIRILSGVWRLAARPDTPEKMALDLLKQKLVRAGAHG